METIGIIQIIRSIKGLNKYIWLGACLTTLGTLLLTNTDLRFALFGAVLTSAGAILFTYGGWRASEGASEKQFSELSRKMDAILQKQAGEVSSEEVMDIVDKFKEWASSFRSNRKAKILETEQRRLNLTRSQIERTNEWRPIFTYFLNTLKSAVESYKTEGYVDLTYDIPPLPDNFFEPAIRNYLVRVSFRNRRGWCIQQDFRSD